MAKRGRCVCVCVWGGGGVEKKKRKAEKKKSQFYFLKYIVSFRANHRHISFKILDDPTYFVLYISLL